MSNTLTGNQALFPSLVAASAQAAGVSGLELAPHPATGEWVMVVKRDGGRHVWHIPVELPAEDTTAAEFVAWVRSALDRAKQGSES